MEGDALEHTRYWQYVMQNGKDSLYKAYVVSLDLYVMFCWEQLGGLANLLTGLLIAEVRPGCQGRKHSLHAADGTLTACGGINSLSAPQLEVHLSPAACPAVMI